jgi:hypothetical protein
LLVDRVVVQGWSLAEVSDAAMSVSELPASGLLVVVAAIDPEAPAHSAEAAAQTLNQPGRTRASPNADRAVSGGFRRFPAVPRPIPRGTSIPPNPAQPREKSLKQAKIRRRLEGAILAGLVFKTGAFNRSATLPSANLREG